jgi:hypothetical protein
MGKVRLGNKSLCNIEGVGDVLIKTKDGCSLFLRQVRHVLELGMNLVSTGKLDDEGFHIVFGKGGWKIVKGSLVVAKGQKIGTLYTLKSKLQKSDIVVVTKEEPTTYLWHKRLGHMTERGLKILVEKKLFPGIKGT